jgi:hypothetical protein
VLFWCIEGKRRSDNDLEMLVALGRGGHTTTLTWRFVHDASGWRAMVTLRRRLDAVIVDFAQGAIGLDLKRRKGYQALWGGQAPPWVTLSSGP